MTEKQLQAAIVECARLLGWLTYHTFDSRRSSPGFPDLILIRGGRLIAAELKSETGKMRPEQDAWLEAFIGTGALAAVWRPSHWLAGLVEETLRVGA